MPRIIFIYLITIFFCFYGKSQLPIKKELISATTTPVSIIITEVNDRPVEGQKVLFYRKEDNKYFEGITAANGSFTIYLPIGKTYTVGVLNFTDTMTYNIFEIPSSLSDPFFKRPFVVHLILKNPKRYFLKTVRFDFNKANLKNVSFPELDTIANFMKVKSNRHFEICGYSDNKGSAVYNEKLSLLRAKSVRNYLIRKGVMADHLIAKAYGASQPLAENNSETGRQINRRVEINY